VRDLWPEAHLWPPVAIRQPSVCREPGSYRPFARRVRPGVRVRCAAGPGHQRRFSGRELARADAPLLDRGLDGLRCAVLGGYFTTWCDADARRRGAGGEGARRAG
jgi:hypothetical protein